MAKHGAYTPARFVLLEMFAERSFCLIEQKRDSTNVLFSLVPPTTPVAFPWHNQVLP